MNAIFAILKPFLLSYLGPLLIGGGLIALYIFCYTSGRRDEALKWQAEQAQTILNARIGIVKQGEKNDLLNTKILSQYYSILANIDAPVFPGSVPSNDANKSMRPISDASRGIAPITERSLRICQTKLAGMWQWADGHAQDRVSCASN